MLPCRISVITGDPVFLLDPLHRLFPSHFPVLALPATSVDHATRPLPLIEAAMLVPCP